MTWRTYRSTDAGSPSLSDAVGSLSNLLKTVLVGTAGTAYGSTPAAGWSVAATGTNKAALQNAGSGCCLIVDHSTATNFPTVYGAESVSVGFVETARIPTSAQVATPLWQISATADGTNRPWIIFADDRRFYIWVGYNMTTAQALSASTTLQMLWFAGDILSYKGADAFSFMVSTQNATTSTACKFGSVQTAIGYIPDTGEYMARSYTQAGASTLVGTLSDYAVSGLANSGANSYYSYPDVVSGGMCLSKIRVIESFVYGPRGEMPGMWFIHHDLPGANGDTFSGSSAGPLAGKSFILLDACASGSRVRFALETSNTLSY